MTIGLTRLCHGSDYLESMLILGQKKRDLTWFEIFDQSLQLAFFATSISFYLRRTPGLERAKIIGSQAWRICYERLGIDC